MKMQCNIPETKLKRCKNKIQTILQKGHILATLLPKIQGNISNYLAHKMHCEIIETNLKHCQDKITFLCHEDLSMFFGQNLIQPFFPKSFNCLCQILEALHHSKHNR